MILKYSYCRNSYDGNKDTEINFNSKILLFVAGQRVFELFAEVLTDVIRLKFIKGLLKKLHQFFELKGITASLRSAVIPWVGSLQS